VLSEEEFNKNKLTYFTNGVTLAKDILKDFENMETTEEMGEDIEAFLYVFSLRGKTMIDPSLNFPLEQRLEQLGGLWALAVSMYALGRIHESSRDDSSGDGS